MLNVLAFDFGAGSGRAMVGSFDGKRIALNEVHRFSNDPVQLGSSYYWDFLRLFFEMGQGIKKASAAATLASMGIDTWGVDFGLLDSKGKLLGNPLHYRDSAVSGMLEEAFGIIPGKEIYKKTGVQFLPFNTIYQLMAMKKNQSPLLEKASTMLFIPDLMRYFLTGEKTTEYTIASTSQMLGAAGTSWCSELLEALGVTTSILTEIVPSGTIGGEILPSIGCQLGVGSLPVVTVAEHDTASAVISVPANESEYAYLSSGTWSLLGIETAKPMINDLTFRANYTNEGGFNNSIRFLKNIAGLWIYQECKKEWENSGESCSYDDLEKAALECPSFLSLIDPDDAGFSTPGNMPEKIRTYLHRTGQPVPDSNPQIVRCIMESLALKYRMTFESLEEIVRHSIPVLHIVGGGSRNRLLSQFTANAIGRMVVAGPVEATAIGNIIVQLIALGEFKNLSEGRAAIRESFQMEVYEPKDKMLWDSAYERFLKLNKTNPRDI